MSDFEQYLIDSFGETWERSGIMDAHNAAIKQQLAAAIEALEEISKGESGAYLVSKAALAKIDQKNWIRAED